MMRWVCVLGLGLAVACGGKSNSDDKGNGGATSSGGASGGKTAGAGGFGVAGDESFGGALAGAAGGAAPAKGGSGPGSGGGGGADNPGTIVTGPTYSTSQLDLLLMIDNSLSMADKQSVLAGSLPSMLLRLTSPNCLDAQGAPTGEKADPTGACSVGKPEFAPVADLHIGVITSSLGAHGSQTCADVYGDDKAQLLPLVRTDAMYPVTTWNGSGFLSWDPRGKTGVSDLNTLTSDFKNLVLSAGQVGCGFESQLESWYRFLVDPNPPLSVPQVRDPSSLTRPEYASNPSENPILQQRAQFLRPDSVVAVLMLTDENDCSIIDQGQGWLVGQQSLGGSSFRMPRSTGVCATNPNDKCCRSCLSAGAVNGCGNAYDDANCKSGTYSTAPEDSLNLRCFDQKRRFGFDLLHPLSRYVDALTKSLALNDLTGQFVQNPLFSPSGKRTAKQVFLGGIVGVPWQDLASAESLIGPTLEYLSFQELSAQGRWDVVLGSLGDTATPPGPPLDKLMFETPLDRTTLFGAAPHPLIGNVAALASASATGRPNQINGHETNVSKFDDLQYACIFPLPTPRTCMGAGCDCDEVSDYNRPQCQGTTQVAAKAYPSVRELRVLKSVGDISGNAVVASICPKTLDASDPTQYGYVPAMSALVKAMKPALQ